MTEKKKTIEKIGKKMDLHLNLQSIILLRDQRRKIGNQKNADLKILMEKQKMKLKFLQACKYYYDHYIYFFSLKFYMSIFAFFRSKALSGVQEKLSTLTQNKENEDVKRSKSRSLSRGRKSSSKNKSRENSIDANNQDNSGKREEKGSKRSGSSASSERFKKKNVYVQISYFYGNKLLIIYNIKFLL